MNILSLNTKVTLKIVPLKAPCVTVEMTYDCDVTYGRLTDGSEWIFLGEPLCGSIFCDKLEYTYIDRVSSFKTVHGANLDRYSSIKYFLFSRTISIFFMKYLLYQLCL